MLQSWTADLGVGAVSTEHVWSRVVALAEESDAADDSGGFIFYGFFRILPRNARFLPSFAALDRVLLG